MNEIYKIVKMEFYEVQGGYFINKEGTLIYNSNRKSYVVPFIDCDYYIFKINGKKLKVHRVLATIFVPNPGNKPQVDHIDRNTRNNNINNLRWCTQSENAKNKPVYLNNKSGFRGISLRTDHKNGGWRATIHSDGKKFSKSFPPTPEGFEEAKKWRLEMEIKLWSEFRPQ